MFPARNDMFTFSCFDQTGRIVVASNTWSHPDFWVAAPSRRPVRSRHSVGPTPKSTSVWPHAGEPP